MQRRALVLSFLGVLASSRPGVCQCPDGSPPPCTRAAARPAAPPSNSVAVLYFDNLSRDSANAYIADGLTEELIVRLGQVPRIDVKSRFESQRVRGGAPLDPRALGRTLGAAWIVTGSLQQAGQRVRLTVSLVRTSNGAQAWGNLYDRSGSDLLQIQSDIAAEVTRAITGQVLPAERASLARRPTRDLIAYDLYLRGLAASNSLTETGLRAALALFDRALARDSGFADAWAQEAQIWLILSDSYVTGRDGYSRVRVASERAIAADSTNALAWAMLVFAAIALDFDGAEGVRVGERGVALDPRSPMARTSYAHALAMAGRLDEAFAQAHAAWRADTLATFPSLGYLMVTLMARSPDSVLAALPRMQAALAPEDLSAWEGWARLVRGDAAGAETQLTWPYFGGWFGGERVRALVLIGRRTEAEATLDSMVAEYHRGYFNAYPIAKGYAALGMADSAFAWLERAREQRTHWLIFTPWDPMLEPLRTDPRFSAFLAGVGRR